MCNDSSVKIIFFFNYLVREVDLGSQMHRIQKSIFRTNTFLNKITVFHKKTLVLT